VAVSGGDDLNRCTCRHFTHDGGPAAQCFIIRMRRQHQARAACRPRCNVFSPRQQKRPYESGQPVTKRGKCPLAHKVAELPTNRILEIVGIGPFVAVSDDVAVSGSGFVVCWSCLVGFGL
jgi:hypothetical protein